MSWHSIGNSLRPAAPLNLSITNWNSSSRGAGPEARPPNVLSLSPAGRTSEVSHWGTCPAYRSEMSSRRDLAHPGLLSPTLITVSVLCMSSLTTGNLSMQCRSTEKPTPVPHIKMYIVSSNALGLSTGTYEQLYAPTWQRSSAGPDVIKALMLGMMSWFNTASSSSLRNLLSSL